MMDPAAQATQNLALWLLAQEGIADKPSETEEMHAAFRVCEKLRQSLSTLAGAAGYRSLISRALTLAKKETPSPGKDRSRKMDPWSGQKRLSHNRAWMKPRRGESFSWLSCSDCFLPSLARL